MKIRVVTDSPGDIPPELVQKYEIGVIPVYINFGVQESFLDDGVQITKAQFYSRLKTANPLPTTAAPSPGEAEKVLRRALEGADHVVAVHLAEALSGTLGSTRIAAQNVGADKVTILDTGSTSMGTGWQALAAAEAIAQGADLPTVVKIVESTKRRMNLWAVPSTIDYLRRSGRVNALVASVGEILDIKPIISVKDSQVVSVGRVRTFKKVIPKLVELCRSHAPLERLAILQIDNPEGAEELHTLLQDIAPPDQTHIIFAAAAIGANFGPGGLGLAIVSKA